jgi:hypothetical protein
MNAVNLVGRLTYAVAGQVDWLVRLHSLSFHLRDAITATKRSRALDAPFAIGSDGHINSDIQRSQ